VSRFTGLLACAAIADDPSHLVTQTAGYLAAVLAGLEPLAH